MTSKYASTDTPGGVPRRASRLEPELFFVIKVRGEL
jgi:hypothetical protein